MRSLDGQYHEKHFSQRIVIKILSLDLTAYVLKQIFLILCSSELDRIAVNLEVTFNAFCGSVI